MNIYNKNYYIVCGKNLYPGFISYWNQDWHNNDRDTTKNNIQMFLLLRYVYVRQKLGGKTLYMSYMPQSITNVCTYILCILCIKTFAVVKEVDLEVLITKLWEHVQLVS